MAAFKFPHFRRGGSHPTLRERARSLACSTAKVLHLPVHPRAERPADSMRYGDGDGLPPVDAYLVALRPQFDQLYLDAEAEGISEDERARRVDALDHKADVILEAEPETIIGLAVQAHVVETLSHVGEAEILAAGIKRLAGDAAPQMVSMMKLREARQGSGGAPALSWSVPGTAARDAELVKAAHEHEATGAAMEEGTKTDDELDTLLDRQGEIEAVLCSTPARSVVGLKAKADVLRSFLEPDPGRGRVGDDIGRLTWSILEDISRFPSPSDDPAFAAIEACRAAWDVYGDALSVRDEGKPDPDASRRGDDACDASWRAWRDGMLKVCPTTPAGAAALARYMVEHTENLADMDSPSEALAALADALEAMAGVAPPVSLKDEQKPDAAPAVDTADDPASRRAGCDLFGVLFDMEDDVRSVVDFFHALNSIGNSTLGLGPEQTGGMLRVVTAGLDHAVAVKEAWERAFDLAVIAKRQAEPA